MQYHICIQVFLHDAFRDLLIWTFLFNRCKLVLVILSFIQLLLFSWSFHINEGMSDHAVYRKKASSQNTMPFFVRNLENYFFISLIFLQFFFFFLTDFFSFKEKIMRSWILISLLCVLLELRIKKKWRKHGILCTEYVPLVFSILSTITLMTSIYDWCAHCSTL
jgi:hypothetical protein